MHILERGDGTADDVRDRVPLPASIGPRAFGPGPAELARAGIIERAAYRPSARAAAHARPVSVWRLTEPHGERLAVRWLRLHPDPYPNNATPLLVGSEAAPIGGPLCASKPRE